MHFMYSLRSKISVSNLVQLCTTVSTKLRHLFGDRGSMILTNPELWETLSTMQYLPFVEQTLYARICARETSVRFIHQKLTLEYVKDDPAWKYEEFLIRQNNHCNFNSFFETYISIYFVHVLCWTLNILSGKWEYIQGSEAPSVQINGSKTPLARPT